MTEAKGEKLAVLSTEEANICLDGDNVYVTACVAPTCVWPCRYSAADLGQIIISNILTLSKPGNQFSTVYGTKWLHTVAYMTVLYTVHIVCGLSLCLLLLPMEALYLAITMKGLLRSVKCGRLFGCGLWITGGLLHCYRSHQTCQLVHVGGSGSCRIGLQIWTEDRLKCLWILREEVSGWHHQTWI